MSENLIYRGTHATIDFTVYDSAGAEQSLAATDAIYFTVCTSRSQDSTLDLNSIDDASQVYRLDQTTYPGQGQVILTPVETLALSARHYVMSLLLVSAAGQRSVVLGPTAIHVAEAGTSVAASGIGSGVAAGVAAAAAVGTTV